MAKSHQIMTVASTLKPATTSAPTFVTSVADPSSFFFGYSNGSQTSTNGNSEVLNMAKSNQIMTVASTKRPTTTNASTCFSYLNSSQTSTYGSCAQSKNTTFSSFQTNPSAAAALQFGNHFGANTAPAPSFRSDFSFGKTGSTNELPTTLASSSLVASSSGINIAQPMLGGTAAPTFGKTDKPVFRFGTSQGPSTPVYQFEDSFKVLAEQMSFAEKCTENHRNYELEIYDYMIGVRQMLKDVLNLLFTTEMDKAYGDAWHNLKREYISLKDFLNLIIKYRPTAFRFLIDTENNLPFLEEKAKKPEGFLGERTECLKILSTIDKLFSFLQKKKQPDIYVPAAEVPKIKVMTEIAFSKLSECEKYLNNLENAIKQTETSCCMEVFNYNFGIINQLCGCVSDFCGINHDLIYDQTVPFPPKSEFLCIMPRFHNSLDQLK